MAYKCLKCKGTFESTSHARVCYGVDTPPAPPAPVAKVPHVTFKTSPNERDTRSTRTVSIRQQETIDRMAQERGVTYQVPHNMLQASRLIKALGAWNGPINPGPLPQPPVTQPAPVSPLPQPPVTPAPAPEYKPFNKMMLDRIPDGRYGVTSDDGKQTVFMRKRTYKSDAKNGYRGATVIQCKSSDYWTNAAIYWPSGSVSTPVKTWQGTDIRDVLAIIFGDSLKASQVYSERFSECSNCGRELTDDRSRYYGLGSDCIQRREDIVRYVDNQKGEYKPGAASRD